MDEDPSSTSYSLPSRIVAWTTLIGLPVVYTIVMFSFGGDTVSRNPWHWVALSPLIVFSGFYSGYNSILAALSMVKLKLMA